MPLSDLHLPPPPAIAEDWALFLDVDGTLLDFASRPEAVQVPAGLPETLRRVAERLGGALALVSGRPLAQLDALFAPLELPAAGLHGLERRIDGRLVDPPPPSRPLQALMHNARVLAAQYPGALVEDKGSTLAMHWRGNPDAQPAMLHLAESALPWLPGYRLQPGDQVLELRPGGHDKGTAIEAMLDSVPFRGRRPVFVGDDLTDEHGFEVVLARRGLAVLVGDRSPSIADCRLPDPDSVIAWLEQAGVRA